MESGQTQWPASNNAPLCNAKSGLLPMMFVAQSMAWDFKQYVLGTLFYRFISENFANYIEGGDASIHYAELNDDVITADIKDDAIKTKGYFIYPSQLFVNQQRANSNERLNTDLANLSRYWKFCQWLSVWARY